LHQRPLQMLTRRFLSNLTGVKTFEWTWLLRWNRCKQERWQPVFFFFFAPQRTRKTKINKEKKKKAIDQLEIAHSFKLRRLTGVGSDILFIFLGGQNDDLQSMTSSVEFENL
jgi:hypothetical protein